MRTVGHRAVPVDLSKVATVADVAARVAQAFDALPADPRRIVRRWSARLGVTAKLAGVGLSIAPAAARPPADEARAALLELLDVPLGLHQADGGLTVVCLDEFQDLLVADDSLDGLLQADGLGGDRAVDELLAFTNGHPQRTVLLAHHLYNILDTDEQPDDLATSALDLAIAETSDAHQAVWEG
jgi:hypothetical protein